MRWIDRGPEPATVADYAQQFTPGWVEHYQQNRGQAPPDSFWREYRSSLGARSNNECWYCGRQCNAMVGDKSPTVDHFRPRRWFPELTYRWSNWVFSCQRCNESKGDLWPETGFGDATGYGYIDPCAADPAERPERCFDYDADTGEILPRNDLSGPAQRKAWDTIDDLGLNNNVLSGLRKAWTDDFRRGLRRLSTSEQQALIATFTEQPVEYAGATGMMVAQLRQAGRVPP